jgi:hypothetical protein
MSNTIRNGGKLPQWLRKQIAETRDVIEGYSGADDWFSKQWYNDPDYRVQQNDRIVRYYTRDRKHRPLRHSKSNENCDGRCLETGESSRSKKMQRREWSKSQRRCDKMEIDDQIIDLHADQEAA